MTSEMQLTQAAGLAPTAHDPHHLAYSAHMLPPAKPVGFRKMHRLLRGRYPFVIIAGIVFAGLGAFFGYVLPKPQYASEGRVMLADSIPVPEEPTDVPRPGFAAFIQGQVVTIETHEMVGRAMAEPEWQASGDPQLDEEHFYDAVTADVIPATNLISIIFTDPNPKVAQAGAMSVVKAFQKFYENSDALRFSAKLDEMDGEIRRLNTDLESRKSTKQDLQNEYGTDNLDSILNTAQTQLAETDRSIEETQLNVDLATQTQQAQTQAKADPKAVDPDRVPLTPDQIANQFKDPTMKGWLDHENDLQMRMDQEMASGYGADYPPLQGLRNDIKVLQKKVQDYTDAFNKNNIIATSAGGGDVLTAMNVQDALRNGALRLRLLHAERDKEAVNVRDLGRKQADLHDYNRQIEDMQGKLNLLQSKHDDMAADQQELSQTQFQLVQSPPEQKQPTSDPRKKLAALGFVFGGLFPAGLVLLFSLLDGRFRYSDEANTDLGGVPLLGILPNLPDLLTDPQQAATAAHCVHQIRTILQITGHSMDRRVFTVTSSSSGDGKTSLTLALGLSFSASGSRTLLIDGDLVGGGLTARLNVKVDHGVLEAMASRDVMPFIRGTDVVDLSILPIGQALGGYTGTIAPLAVRRLVDEARKHFDVIIIDTGPILGSIEASPVAVAADGVILCVSRGQQRQLVDRAVTHLHSIGAKLAGVVFNRAQAHDFDRSMSRMSMKPLPGANGRGGADRIGPVAKAVASSVRAGSGSSGGNGHHS